ncbi:MAG TPA: hypothetical protein PL089_02935 [Ignavibacteria bacterium]|nr:hypothetical protein [Ignavibacteria bacterium]
MNCDLSNSNEFFRFPIKNNTHPIEIRDFLLSFELILELFEKEDSEKYKIIHKGTPFYFIAMGAIMVGDFEKGVFYMDAAKSEDEKNGFGMEQPAGLFFNFEANNENQAAVLFV